LTVGESATLSRFKFSRKIRGSAIFDFCNTICRSPTSESLKVLLRDLLSVFDYEDPDRPDRLLAQRCKPFEFRWLAPIQRLLQALPFREMPMRFGGSLQVEGYFLFPPNG
jgi:hypothetical protein